MFRLLFLLLGSAVCFVSTVADDLYGGFNQSAAFTVTTADLSLTDRPTDRPIDEAVPFSSVESGLRSTGPVLAETSLSLSSLTTAVQAFFTLCPQPGQTVPPLPTENFYLLQDWQQEIKEMPADLSKFPTCSEQITAFVSVLNESSGECSFTQRQEMQTAYQSVAECAGLTTAIEPLGNAEMDLYREKMVLTIWHSALVSWQKSPESAEFTADLQQKSLELLNMLSGSENIQYRQLTEEISELYALLSLSSEESEPYLSQAKQLANSLAALVTTQASGMQFRFYQPDAGNESPTAEERCGCEWKRSNFRVTPVSPATLPLSVNVPWQITYNYTLKGNSSECPLPKAQATLKDGTNFVLPTGHHVVSYSAPSGQGVIRFNSAPSNPAKYNVSLIFLDPGVKKPVPFNLGIHEWKHNGTKLTRLELHQDGFSLVAPNNSTKIMTLVPSSPLNIKVYMSGQKPLNDILHVYYDAAGRNIKLFQEPLQNRTVVSFTIGKEKLSGLPVGRGGIRAYLSGMAEPVPTLRYQPNPTLIAAMTAMLREETFYVKWRAEAGENIRLCENGDNLEKGGFITIPPPKPDATGRLLMPEVLECNFIVGRVRDGVFIPVKEPTKVLIKENVEDLLYVDEEGNPEKPVVAIPRAYYTNKDEEFRIAELRTDAQGKLNNVKLSSFAHYRRDSELWDASEGNYYIAPKSGRIYFDGFKLFPSAKNDTGQEVNYLTVPQWILEPSRDFAPIQKPNPKWFNESLRYYLNGIKSLKTKEPGSYLVLTFEQVYFLGSDNSINRYFIRPRPVFNKASKKQIFGFHSYEKKVIDINVFSELVRLDLPHVEKDYYGEDFDYDNMFFATLLHETRHAFQANMRHVKFLPVPGGQLKSVDADGDYLFDPHYIKQQNWSIAKNGFGYLIDDNHSELPDYKNQLFEVNFTDDNGEDKKFKGFSGDRVDDRDKTAYPKQWNAAKELDARYFSQRYNKTLFGR